jgi:hypothetical protein
LAENTEFTEKLAGWQNSYQEFCAFVQQIPSDQQLTPGVCGVWSSKELIAHIAGWHREALKRYEDYQNGDTGGKKYDFDEFNAASVSALSLLNWRETFETLQQTYDDLLDALNKLTAEQITNDSRYAAWLDGLREDFEEHTEQVKAWLSASKE